jgi:hypothetical protein
MAHVLGCVRAGILRVSVLDKTWEWRSASSWGGVGVTLVDPVETILRRLSVPYLEAARAVAVEELEAFLGHRIELVPVFFHPWKSNWLPDLDPSISELVPGFDRSAPFTGVGWLAQGVDEEGLIVSRESANILPDRGRSLCVRLLERTPRLSLCGGVRWAWPANASTDCETQLAVLLAENDVDWTDWIIDAEPAGIATTVWDRARRAAHRGDAGAVRAQLAAAWRHYSPAGCRMLSAGVLNFLARRLEQQADP